jgi:lipopolysaccharide export system protein LptA
MPTQVQFRRGTTAQNNAFTGAAGELSVDTTLNTLRVHDGSTAGGVALVNLTAAQTLTNKTLTSPSIGTSLTTASSSFDLLNTTATTINFGQGATSLSMGSSTGTSYINNATISLPNATSITTGQTTVALLNTTATTVNAFGAATTLSIGAATGTLTINNANTVITGNLTVNGTTTTINATTLTVDDKNIELGSVGTPSDVTADGGGITLKGATDKSITWSSVGWTSSEDFNLVTGKVYEINGTSVLSATTLGSAVVTSSLTTVGTIGTGTWQGTAIVGQYGGTGVNNSGKTITIGGNFTHTGAHTLGLTTTANTSVTLPTTGTLATLAGSETFTNKTLTSPIIGTISNTGTLTLPTSTDTLVGRATTDTLTNKTLSAAVLSGTLTAGGGVGSNGQVLASTGSGVQWSTPTVYASTGKAIAMAMVFGG